MNWREIAVAVALISVGCAQMVGDVLHFPTLKAIGAASAASPAPKVFTAQDGFETYANRFFLEWHDDTGRKHVLELTPQSYSRVRGPYNRRNVYGAVLSYAPVLEANPMTRPMFQTVLKRLFCGSQPVFVEVGLPADTARYGPLRIRLESRRPSEVQRFKLVYEVGCGG